jgi:hypothetical protein
MQVGTGVFVKKMFWIFVLWSIVNEVFRSRVEDYLFFEFDMEQRDDRRCETG